MKIFWAFCIYNEREMLPFKIDFMRKNAINFYVFDNVSVDGSWEWLQENKIPSGRFNSDGMFNLTLNLSLLTKKIHEVKPDWVIMAGTDTFYVHGKRTLRETIESVDKQGFNCIYDVFKSFQFMFTGEEKPGEDPRLTYMYYVLKSFNNVCCIAKYCSQLKFRSADCLVVPKAKLYQDGDFVALHYSMRHDAENRKTEQYIRRKKAWDSGRTARCYGTHYERIVNSGRFIFDKKDLLDVRDSFLWGAIRKSVEA